MRLLAQGAVVVAEGQLDAASSRSVVIRLSKLVRLHAQGAVVVAEGQLDAARGQCVH